MFKAFDFLVEDGVVIIGNAWSFFPLRFNGRRDIFLVCFLVLSNKCIPAVSGEEWLDEGSIGGELIRGWGRCHFLIGDGSVGSGLVWIFVTVDESLG